MGKNKIRWWPAAVIVTANLLTTIWIWQFYENIKQYKVLNTLILEGVTFLLLLIWILLFSRMIWKVKFTIFGICAASVLLFAVLFEIPEMNADFVPIIEWRWRQAGKLPALSTTGAREVIQKLPVPPGLKDYAQFLGPNRTAVLPGIELQRDWNKYPPKLIWKQPIGHGWSAFAVKDRLAVTMEQHDSLEVVVCYDMLSGKVLWKHADKARYDTAIGGIGPRSTPTIDGNRVFSLGATGLLNCLELDSGSMVWQTNILLQNDAKSPVWGVSNSPLVLDRLVVVCAGGANNKSLVAYDKITGTRVWSGGTDAAHYSSPMLATIAGEPQILIFTIDHIVGHDPAVGRVLWQFPWPPGTEKVAQPIVLSENRIFVTTGYGVGSKLFKVSKNDAGVFATGLIWESKRFKAKFTNVVHKEGHIYGLDDGILACLDLKNGKRCWKRGRYGHGQLILVDDLLLITSEKGEIALVEAQPQAYNELAFMPAITGKTWNNPALAGNYLLIRNGQEAACFELAVVHQAAAY